MEDYKIGDEHLADLSCWHEEDLLEMTHLLANLVSLVDDEETTLDEWIDRRLH
jgi:hypothetical protein